jgi:hypothetical protein
LQSWGLLNFPSLLYLTPVMSWVARWYIFKPKIPVWVNFGGPRNGKGWCRYSMPIWNMLWPFHILYEHLVLKLRFGIFFPTLVFCVKKNLETLVMRIPVNRFDANSFSHNFRLKVS